MNRLELDGYCQELQLAFEYNGEQHYKWSKHYHRTEEQFKNMQDRDERKLNYCDENNVCLIIIPYTIEFVDIREFIRDILIDGCGYTIAGKVGSDLEFYNRIRMNSAYCQIYNQKIINLVADKYTILPESHYINEMAFTYTLQCKFGHIFITKPTLINSYLKTSPFPERLCDICRNMALNKN